MSYDFDGSADWFTSTDAALTGLVPPFSVACWFNSDTTSGEHRLWSIGNTSTTDQEHSLYGFNASVRALTRAAGNGIAAASGSFSTTTWTHAAGRWIATNSRRAYRDGANEGTNTTTRVPSGINTSLVGREGRNTSTRLWDGRIGELAVWDVDIGADAITALAKGFSPLLVHPNSLIDYWQMIRHSRGVRGINWTEVSAPPIAEHTRVFMPSKPHIGLAPFVAPPAGDIIPEIMHHRKQMQAA